MPKKLNQMVMWAKPAFIGTIITSLILGVCIIVQAYLFSLVINKVHLEGAKLRDVMSLLCFMAGIIIIRAFLTWISDVFAGKTAAVVKVKLRDSLLRSIVKRIGTSEGSAKTGEMSNVVMEGVDALDAYFSQYLPQLVIAVMLPIIILLIVFPLDWLSGLIFLLTAPLIPVFMILIGKTGEAMTKRQWNLLSRLSSHFLDTIQGLEELKRLNQSLKRAEEIRQTSYAYAKVTTNVLRVTFLSALVLEMVGTISTALVAVQIGLRLLDGGIPFQQAFFILIIAPEFYFPLRQLGVRFHAGMTGRTAAVRIFSLLLKDETEKQITQVSALPEVQNSEIILQNVSYRFPDRDIDAVSEVGFTLAPRQMTALMGQSGSGKSTLSRLLLGFLQPEEGEILINGIPLSHLPDKWWRNQISWVPHQPTLFTGTLRDNINPAGWKTSENRLWEAIERADLTDLVKELPEGLSASISEAGRNFSSGQLQRIALARAFFRDTPILMMDEPTAHLDPDLEFSLNRTIRALVKNRTVLVIAHRFSTILNADQVVVLDAGKVIEVGRPNELIKNGGEFSTLFHRIKPKFNQDTAAGEVL
ncbi:MAG: thiol reductant ABC exporter subunit CydD [Anaerolineaceae bacterium]